MFDLPICEAAMQVDLQHRIGDMRKTVAFALNAMLENRSTLPAERKEAGRLLDGLHLASDFRIDLSPQYLAERELPLERGLGGAQRILRDGYCKPQGSGGRNQIRNVNSTVTPADPRWFVPLSFTDGANRKRHFIVHAAPMGLVKKPMYFEDWDLDEYYPALHQPTPRNIVNIHNESDLVYAFPESDNSYDTRPGMTREVYQAMVEQSVANKWELPDVTTDTNPRTVTILTGNQLLDYNVALAGLVTNGEPEIVTISFGTKSKAEHQAALFTFRPSLEIDPETGEIIKAEMPSGFAGR